jgi:hypothetical protein
MSSDIRYLRVTPYNKNTGSLVQRVNIDGKLFKAGNWYTVPTDVAAQLSKMRQKTGAPMFQICTTQEYRETARHELAAMAAAAGLKGLALQAQQMPEPKKVDDAPRKSNLAGLGKQVIDVDPAEIGGTMTTAHLQPQEDASPEEIEAEESVENAIPDISKMKRPELDAFCKKHDVNVPFGYSNAEVRKLLRDQGIVD